VRREPSARHRNRLIVRFFTKATPSTPRITLKRLVGAGFTEAPCSVPPPSALAMRRLAGCGIRARRVKIILQSRYDIPFHSIEGRSGCAATVTSASMFVYSGTFDKHSVSAGGKPFQVNTDVAKLVGGLVSARIVIVVVPPPP